MPTWGRKPAAFRPLVSAGAFEELALESGLSMLLVFDCCVC